MLPNHYCGFQCCCARKIGTCVLLLMRTAPSRPTMNSGCVGFCQLTRLLRVRASTAVTTLDMCCVTFSSSPTETDIIDIVRQLLVPSALVVRTGVGAVVIGALVVVAAVIVAAVIGAVVVVAVVSTRRQSHLRLLPLFFRP